MLDLIYEMYLSWYGIFTVVLFLIWLLTVLKENDTPDNGVFLLLVSGGGASVWILRYAPAHDEGVRYIGLLFASAVITVMYILTIAGVVPVLRKKIRYRWLRTTEERACHDTLLSWHARLRDHHAGTKTCNNCGRHYNADRVNRILLRYARRYAVKWAASGREPYVVKRFTASMNNCCCCSKCETEYLEKCAEERRKRENEASLRRSYKAVYRMEDSEFRRRQAEWDKAHKKCGNCEHRVDETCTLKAVTSCDGYPGVNKDNPGCSEGFRLRFDAVVPRRVESPLYRITEKGVEEVEQ